MKDMRVENAYVKFHNILVILQFWVELAMHKGHSNESIVWKEKKNGLNYLLIRLFEFVIFEVANIYIVWLPFQSNVQIEPQKT